MSRILASGLVAAVLGMPAAAMARNDAPLTAVYELPGSQAAPVLKPEALPPGPYQPAPIPNPDLLPPQQSPLASDPSLMPHLFMPANRFVGDGYSPGSTVQTEQERRMRPAAGFSLQVPLH